MKYLFCQIFFIFFCFVIIYIKKKGILMKIISFTLIIMSFFSLLLELERNKDKDIQSLFLIMDYKMKYTFLLICLSFSFLKYSYYF